MGAGRSGLSDLDRRHLAAAVTLGARGLGTTAPNPSVGAVIVGADGRTLGRGTTAPGGRPHAEVLALAQAGEAARGGTAYVSLEPCAHHGVTPPCAEALIGAGTARVVVLETDPDPRTAGRGLAMLEAAGIATAVAGEAERAELCRQTDDLNAGFFMRVRTGRPLVTLKLATSLDGRIATGTGESKWITGEAARAAGHLLRATHDAILVGSGTVLADDPMLDCRLPGLGHRSPVRIVLDSELKTPLTAKLVTTARTIPTWIFSPRPPEDAATALGAVGVKICMAVPSPDGHIDVAATLRDLGDAGLTRVLVEGGRGLATALLAADLVDRIVWHRAGTLIGEEGLAAVGPLGLARLADAAAFRFVGVAAAGADRIETWARVR